MKLLKTHVYIRLHTFFLILDNNAIEGTLPTSWANLGGNLTILQLKRNNLVGPFPHEWKSLTNLHVLYLDDNQLSGSLPSEIGMINKLDQLYLSKLRGKWHGLDWTV